LYCIDITSEKGGHSFRITPGHFHALLEPSASIAPSDSAKFIVNLVDGFMSNAMPPSRAACLDILSGKIRP
jgi:hypothetical protein